MDSYRLAGDVTLSTEYADQVLAAGTHPDGSERAPMRMAEARLTLGVAAARSGRLDEALNLGRRALGTARRSLPTLVMVASELGAELDQRFPAEPETHEFHELVRSIC